MSVDALVMGVFVDVVEDAHVPKYKLWNGLWKAVGVRDGARNGERGLGDVLGGVGSTAGRVDVANVYDAGAGALAPHGGEDALWDVPPLKADDVKMLHAGVLTEFLEGGVCEIWGPFPKCSSKSRPCTHNVRP